ncbi:unnamed protein product [Amoebophrya sp. A120]|nr:unnamed protein product [Amoebophrya sp. A120]|eukprot:GSA120T00012171001.1
MKSSGGRSSSCVGARRSSAVSVENLHQAMSDVRTKPSTSTSRALAKVAGAALLLLFGTSGGRSSVRATSALLNLQQKKVLDSVGEELKRTKARRRTHQSSGTTSATLAGKEIDVDDEQDETKSTSASKLDFLISFLREKNLVGAAGSQELSTSTARTSATSKADAEREEKMAEFLEQFTPDAYLRTPDELDSLMETYRESVQVRRKEEKASATSAEGEREAALSAPAEQNRLNKGSTGRHVRHYFARQPSEEEIKAAKEKQAQDLLLRKKRATAAAVTELEVALDPGLFTFAQAAGDFDTHSTADKAMTYGTHWDSHFYINDTDRLGANANTCSGPSYATFSGYFWWQAQLKNGDTRYVEEVRIFNRRHHESELDRARLLVDGDSWDSAMDIGFISSDPANLEESLYSTGGTVVKVKRILNKFRIQDKVRFSLCGIFVYGVMERYNSTALTATQDSADAQDANTHLYPFSAVNGRYPQLAGTISKTATGGGKKDRYWQLTFADGQSHYVDQIRLINQRDTDYLSSLSVYFDADADATPATNAAFSLNDGTRTVDGSTVISARPGGTMVRIERTLRKMKLQNTAGTLDDMVSLAGIEVYKNTTVIRSTTPAPVPVLGKCMCVGMSNFTDAKHAITNPEHQDWITAKNSDSIAPQLQNFSTQVLDPPIDFANSNDTIYGRLYETKYGGAPNYGEYCFAWEDNAKENTAGGAGTNTYYGRSAMNEDCNGTSTDRPKWCMQDWCYLKYADPIIAPDGDIVQRDANSGPMCDNVADVTISKYKDSFIWYSYEFCSQ